MGSLSLNQSWLRYALKEVINNKFNAPLSLDSNLCGYHMNACRVYNVFNTCMCCLSDPDNNYLIEFELLLPI